METIIDVYLSDGFIKHIVTRGDIMPIVDNVQKVAKSVIDPTSTVTLEDYPPKIPNHIRFKLKITHLGEIKISAAEKLLDTIKTDITSSIVMEANYPKAPYEPFFQRIAIENTTIVR